MNTSYKKVRYNFSDYNNEIDIYLRKVYRNSLDYYNKKYNVNSTGTRKLDLETINKSIGYLEDYLFYIYKLDSSAFRDVFNSLKRNVKILTVFEKKDRGLYGQYIPNAGIVFINPELRKSQNLTKDEKTRLYLCHEVGHAVHSDWIHTLANNIRTNDVEFKSLIYQGFNLLDEATTQDLAEDIAYCYAGKRRPNLRLFESSYSAEYQYYANYDFYGNLKEPATLFSKTLRGIGKYDDNNIALRLLSKRALSKNFINDIVYEYTRDGHIDELYFLMSYLGIIKKASYATFGYDNPKYIKEAPKAFNEVKNMASNLRDRREPFNRYFF